MIYSIGDLFVDIRVTQKRRFRRFLITDVFVDGLEPIDYELYITPDEKDDVWSHGMLRMYVDKGYFIDYPVVK
jgi:hypothetical protein